MMNRKFWILLLVLMSALALSFACGGGDDDDDDDDDDDVGEGTPGVLHGYVRDFQTKVEVNNATVEAVNDETGESFSPAITVTTGSDGEVSFEIPDGHDFIGVLVKKEGSLDTIQFHFEVGTKNEEFLLVNEGTKDLMLLSLGLDMDTTKAIVAGGIYWGDPADEDAVGCAMVSFDPDDGRDVHYFGPDALPNAARNITGDTPTNGQGTLEAYAQADNHALSYYVSINKDPDSDVNLLATVFDTAGGDGTGDSNQESNIIPMLYANTVTIVNVYFSKDKYTSSPTPAWCTE